MLWWVSGNITWTFEPLIHWNMNVDTALSLYYTVKQLCERREGSETDKTSSVLLILALIYIEILYKMRWIPSRLKMRRQCRKWDYLLIENIFSEAYTPWPSWLHTRFPSYLCLIFKHLLASNVEVGIKIRVSVESWFEWLDRRQGSRNSGKRNRPSTFLWTQDVILKYAVEFLLTEFIPRQLPVGLSDW